MPNENEMKNVVNDAKAEVDIWADTVADAAKTVIDAYMGGDWKDLNAKPAVSVITATASLSGSMIGLMRRFAAAAAEEG